MATAGQMLSVDYCIFRWSDCIYVSRHIIAVLLLKCEFMIMYVVRLTWRSLVIMTLYIITSLDGYMQGTLYTAVICWYSFLCELCWKVLTFILIWMFGVSDGKFVSYSDIQTLFLKFCILRTVWCCYNHQISTATTVVGYCQTNAATAVFYSVLDGHSWVLFTTNCPSLFQQHTFCCGE